MDDLIIRALQGRATAEERERLQRWRAETPQNEWRYRELEGLWGVTEAAALSRERRVIPDADALIDRAEREASDPAPAVVEEGAARRGRWHVPWTNVLKVAAAAALLIPAGLALGTLIDGADPDPGMLAGGEITTGAGEMTTVTLGDGTSIRLGSRSSLRLTEEGQNQVAWLDGRAFFGVQSDPERTFTVRTAYGEAVVLGTRFEVRSEEEEFRVLVVDGGVKVSAADVEAELREGEMSQGREGEAPTISRVDDVYAHLDWIGNALVFQATPLRRALEEVERSYGVEVILVRPALADLEVTATFTGQELNQVVLVLCEIIGIDCSIDDGVVRVGIDRLTSGTRLGGGRL